MDLCHLKNSELEPQFQKYQGRVVLRGDIVKDDSGAYTVFTEQGSSALQMTAAKVMDVTARLPDCDGQAADAVSAYTQVIHQFWKRFVLYIATTGLVEKRSGNSHWKQWAICVKFIFRSSIRAKRRNSSWKLVRSTKNPKPFPKTEIARSACEPKWQGLLVMQYLEQKTLVIWWQQITKSSTREVNLETITDTLPWYKILPLNGLNHIRVKQRLHMRRRRVYESF